MAEMEYRSPEWTNQTLALDSAIMIVCLKHRTASRKQNRKFPNDSIFLGPYYTNYRITSFGIRDLSLTRVSYLFEQLVPVVLMKALIVPEFLLILCRHRGNRNNAGGKGEDIVKHRVRENTWKDRE